MNQQILLDWIEREQAENLPKAKNWESKTTRKYNADYYHGYYNGYLSALINLRILLANNKEA